MTNPTIFQTFAAYNRWMNEKVYDICAGMPDTERKRDRGAYFGSIHGTLNHILSGDWGWLGRLADFDRTAPPMGTDVFDAFEPLRAARQETDAFICAWTDGLTDEWLADELNWDSRLDGTTRSQPHWLLVAHLFNHQTHHRGQLTTLLSQAGYDVGITDLPRMDQA